MRLLDSLYPRLSHLPEFAGIGKSERKRIVRSCRWKIFRHWQYWVSSIAVFLFIVILYLVIALWYVNLNARFLSLPLISISAFMSLLLILAFVYLAQQIKIYYLAPYLVQAMPDGINDTNSHTNNQQLRKRTIKKGLLYSIPPLILVFACVAIAIQNPDKGCATLKMPEELNTARVVKNLPGMTKKLFLEDKRLGVITDIVFHNSSNERPKATVIAGTMGALFTDTGLPANFVPFEKRQNDVNFIKLSSQGVYGFMNRGAWCSDARVMDETGKEIWSYAAGDNGIDDMAAGDIDGDGLPEYAVGFNGGGGIHLLNNQGKKLWEFRDGNVWHVEIADVDDSGQKRIVHSNAGGKITVRDKSGKIISKTNPKPYFSHFSIIRWPDSSAHEHLLLAEDNTIWIFDSSANVLAKFAAPGSGSLGKGKGIIISGDGENRVLATIIDYENWHRSIIYLHDSAGNLIYQEILSESCPTISALPTDRAEPKRLVLGCEGRLIEYKFPVTLAQ